MSATASFHLKLERAREHLNSFEMEARAWVDTEPYSIIDEPDPEPPLEPIRYDCKARRFRVDRAAEIPGRLSLLIGDCLTSLRSSLDHLAMALAMSFTPSMTAKQITGSEFPIFDNAIDYAKNKARKIGCIAPAAKAAIEALQPYNRGERYASHPLWQIHDMSRIDKHRTLMACAPVSMNEGHRSIAIVEDGQRNFNYFPYITVIGTELKQDAILLRWAGLPIEPNREMRMNPHITPEIVLGGGSLLPGCVIVPLLQSLCDFVGKGVIAPLSKYL